MRKRKKLTIMATTVNVIWLLIGISCEKVELTRSGDQDDTIAIKGDSARMDDKSGISFDMESDSLLNYIEELNFETEEWGEEGMGVDL